MSPNPLNELSNSLGDYLREQRQSARLSLRQLSELAGVSNPYLSQIERGLKRPSAEILKELAKGLQVSAESLYVKAGILDEESVIDQPRLDVRTAIAADHGLTARQKATLLDVYESFVGSAAEKSEQAEKAEETGQADETDQTGQTDKITATKPTTRKTQTSKTQTSKTQTKRNTR